MLTSDGVAFSSKKSDYVAAEGNVVGSYFSIAAYDCATCCMSFYSLACDYSLSFTSDVFKLKFSSLTLLSSIFKLWY